MNAFFYLSPLKTGFSTSTEHPVPSRRDISTPQAIKLINAQKLVGLRQRFASLFLSEKFHGTVELHKGLFQVLYFL